MPSQQQLQKALQELRDLELELYLLNKAQDAAISSKNMMEYIANTPDRLASEINPWVDGGYPSQIYVSDLLVYGYIKHSEIEQTLTTNIRIIPQPIYDLILLFCDGFESFQHYVGDLAFTTNTIIKRTFTMTDSAHITCYGAMKIPSLNHRTRYHWKFKINKRTDSMAIGIDETKSKWKNTNFLRNQSKEEATYSYGLYHDGKKAQWNVHGFTYSKHQKALKYKTNDIVDMILNLNDNTLSYSINGGKKYKVFSKILTGGNIEYYMAIYVYYKGDSISLLETHKFIDYIN
eukprot:204375_1